MRTAKTFPVVISGPSGAGKTTLIDELVAQTPMLRRSVSATTRPPRGDEIDGKDYFFLSPEAFEALKLDGLIEWAEVHGYFYGTPREFFEDTLRGGVDVVLNIDVQGGRKVKKSFADAVMVFILPPSFEVLERRIKRRATDLADDIKKRLQNAHREIEALPEYRYVVVNDELDQAVSTLRAIVDAERVRRTRYAEDFFKPFEDGARK